MPITRTLGSLALVLSLSAMARADAPPPSTPTLFLAVDAPSLRGQTSTLAGAVKTALPRAKGFSVVVVGSDTSSPFPVMQRDEIADALTNRSAHTSLLSSVIFRAVDSWQGGKDLRHHIIVLTGAAPELSRVSTALGSATRDGFTVSFVCLGKADAKARKELQQRGAGHVWTVNARSLAGALRGELGWTKLSKAQEKARQAAVDSYSKDNKVGLLKVLGASGQGGVLGVLRGSGSGNMVGSSAGGVGVGGLGLKGSGGSGGASYRVSGGIGRVGGLGGYTYANPRLRRGESLVGSKVALTFRQVSGGSDVAETRRTLLGAAKPLLACLEAQLSLSGRDEVTVELVVGGKAIGANSAATKCVETWVAASKLPRGQRATLLVGPASAAQ